MALSPQWLDELRSRITLSAIIGRTTKLQKAGREWKACCPFHNEKTPSFTVNDEKGFYHCFGCGAHGDVIRWMTDQQGLSFMDAVRELAAQAGMDLPAADPHTLRQAEQRAGLYEIMMAAQHWFQENLRSAQGTKAREYLAQRGVNAGLIEEFGFGFAPDSRTALKQALGQFEEPLLVEAGLRIAVDGRDPYDRFRGRLMLPIQDSRGRIIAFGGRILDDSEKNTPKYLNSPETPLFNKGRTLYNLHRAAQASRQASRVVVVEGYMDVIALAGSGITEAVAPMGTALTEEQIEVLWRLCDTPILCFDGDAAGERAAMRAVTRALPLLRPGYSLRIAHLPHGMDPDDVINQAGRAGFNVLVDESFSLMEYLWFRERNQVELDTPEKKAGLKDRLSKHIETISDPEIRRLYRTDLFNEFRKFAFHKDDWSVHKPKEDLYDLGKRNKLRSIYGIDADNVYKYMHKRLGAAIARSFILWPSEIYKYVEDLSTVDGIDERISVILDEYIENGSVDMSSLLIAIHLRGLSQPDPQEFDYLRFPFAWPFAERERAHFALRIAILMYVNVRQGREALAVAQARYERDFNESSEAEVARIRNILLGWMEEMKEFERMCPAAMPATGQSVIAKA